MEVGDVFDVDFFLLVMADFCKTGDKGTMLLKNAFDVECNPHFDIYDSMVSDNLHQIGGVYKHLLSFVETMIRNKYRNLSEVKQRYEAIPKFRGVKYFKGGYALKDITNPTYHELCHHMSYLLSVVHGIIPKQASLCIRSFLDFFTQIMSKEHSEATLTAANQYLESFFKYLPVFEEVSGSSLNFPKLHMLNKMSYDILQKSPLDGYSTSHSERMHKTAAKEPAKRTNGHIQTFTRSIAKIIEDRDAFFDLYPTNLYTDTPEPPHASLQPLYTPVLFSNEKKASYTLRHVNNTDERISFEAIKKSEPNMKSLKSTIRLYLDTVVDNNPNAKRVTNTLEIKESVKSYKEKSITDYDEDGQEFSETIREGDYAACESGNDYVYIKIRLFLEVSRTNSENYRLCIGDLYQDVKQPHITGYKVLRLLNSETFVCELNSIDHRAHIVPCYEPKGYYLLNHDISRTCWAHVQNPLLETLTELKNWTSDPARITTSDLLKENIDEIDENTDKVNEEENDEEDRGLEDFLDSIQ